MRSAGDNESIERSRAPAEMPIVRGPLGYKTTQGAVLLSGELAQARQTGFSDPGERRNFKCNPIRGQSLNQARGF